MKAFFTDRFKGKVIIITGAARGIGAATAMRAAQEGAKLVLADRLEKEGNDTLKAVCEAGGEAVFLPLDVSIEENAKLMVEEAVKRFSRVDIAINNAGVMGTPGPVHELSAEHVNYTMSNNFMTVFYCSKYELQQFLAQGDGGVIVNNASIAGLTGLPGNAAYVASKHAVNGLTKNMALDYAKYGIRINSVNPAGTSTPMTEEAYKYVMERQKAAIAAGLDPAKAMSMAGQKTKTMFGHDALAEEQAASILFLASDDASHMTGATLQTDGGWTSF